MVKDVKCINFKSILKKIRLCVDLHTSPYFLDINIPLKYTTDLKVY